MQQQTYSIQDVLKAVNEIFSDMQELGKFAKYIRESYKDSFGEEICGIDNCLTLLALGNLLQHCGDILPEELLKKISSINLSDDLRKLTVSFYQTAQGRCFSEAFDPEKYRRILFQMATASALLQIYMKTRERQAEEALVSSTT